MDALEAIVQRHSTRRFTEEPIPRDILLRIVDTGRFASSANNEQPWSFVVVTDKRRLADVSALTDYGKFISGAAACIAIACTDTAHAIEDGAALSQCLLLAAAALGVQSCWVAGHGKPYAEAAGRLLGFPSHYRLSSLLALGYESEPAHRSHKRELASLLHWETYGAPTTAR